MGKSLDTITREAWLARHEGGRVLARRAAAEQVVDIGEMSEGELTECVVREVIREMQSLDRRVNNASPPAAQADEVRAGLDVAEKGDDLEEMIREKMDRLVHLAASKRVQIAYRGSTYSFDNVPLAVARVQLASEESTENTAKFRAAYWRQHVEYCQKYKKQTKAALPAKARQHLDALAEAGWPTK